MRLPRLGIALLMIVGLLTLSACGPTRKSIFPPLVSVQQVQVRPDGLWHVTLRIQNNSYAGMEFRSINGQLQIADLVPVRLHSTTTRDIPALAGDVITLDLLPTPPMSKALAAVEARGSAGSLPYSVAGVTSATPENEKQPRDFKFSGSDWLSPVPGIANTYR